MIIMNLRIAEPVLIMQRSAIRTVEEIYDTVSSMILRLIIQACRAIRVHVLIVSRVIEGVDDLDIRACC